MDKEIEAAITAATTGKSELAPIEETGKLDLTPKPEEVSPQNSGKAEPTAPAPDMKPEWDGDVNKLPPEQQKWAKAAQRKLTEKAMANAELIRKGQEYEKITASEDWQKFQEAQRKPAAVPQQVQPASPSTAGITAEEWEDAQLDNTGQKFNQLVSREVQRQVNEAANYYGGTIQKIQQENEMTKFNTAVSDFTDLHPDIVELHEAGLMKPLLEEEFRTGQHKTYEQAINAAYERGASLRERLRQDEKQKAQGRVIEKRDAAILPAATTGDLSVVEVDKADAFDKAFEFASQNKKVKVKARR